MQAFDLLNREIFLVKTGKIRPHCGEGGGAAAGRVAPGKRYLVCDEEFHAIKRTSPF